MDLDESVLNIVIIIKHPTVSARALHILNEQDVVYYSTHSLPQL